MMNYNIAVLDGDGIGPEICAGAIKVLNKVGKKFGHNFTFNHYLIGGCAIDECGVPLPEETVKGCLSSDSVLLGAVGGYKWDNMAGDKRPEKGLLQIRKAMGLYSNIRPAKLWTSLAKASPLKYELVKNGVEIIIVRELIGGIYFGDRDKGVDENGNEYAWDTEKYSVPEIERIAKIACELAEKRSKKIVSVDKANVLESSRLWRKTVHEYAAKHYPDITVTDVLVDNMAMQIVKNPAQFDVVVTSNIFGDILSDEAAQVTGSIGMLASSSLGDTKCGLYEPIHGSAPDIAGKDIANPIATILAAAMMLRDSFSLTEEYAAIERAIQTVLDKNLRTADIMEEGMTQISGSKMADAIAEAI
jgi:3-isopropylmalate dehydrogenase